MEQISTTSINGPRIIQWYNGLKMMLEDNRNQLDSGRESLRILLHYSRVCINKTMNLQNISKDICEFRFNLYFCMMNFNVE